MAAISILEERGQLKRINALVDPDLEIVEISNRMLQAGGPGLLFENVEFIPLFGDGHFVFLDLIYIL